LSDDLKKVQTGDRMRIPAQTFNAFIDAAVDYKRRQRGVGRDGQRVHRQTGIILVRNDTGEDLDRFSAVGIAAPIIGPDDNEDEFKNRATAVGIKPIVPDHRGRFAVYIEPVKAGKIAPACVSGVIPCRINVDEETHERADVEHDSTTLLTGHHGGAEILWKEEGEGLKWALVKIGIAEPLAITFDVRLEQVEGEAGDNCEEDCSFKYDIYDIHTDEKLNKDGPQEPIQSDIRPAKTQMIAATRGTAYWTVKENKIVVQLEEAFEEPTPRAQQYVVTGIECGDGGSGSTGGDGGDGGSDCCCITLKYHTSKVCYPPGVKLEDGPTFTIQCGDCGSSSSGSSSGSSGPPSVPPSGSSGPSGSSSFGSSSSDSSSGSSSGGSDSSSADSSGSSGSTSFSGSGSDKSTAIVPARWSPTGYTALFVEESPEVRFNDVMIAEVTGDTRVKIDPRFLDVCEPGSVEVCGGQPDVPVLVGARVEGDEMVIRFAQENPEAVRLVISLTGIRKGFAGLRFPDRTRRQFEANERFIRSAYPHE